MEDLLNRRSFIRHLSVIGTGLAMTDLPEILAARQTDNSLPALLGGTKAFKGQFVQWPVWDMTEEQALLKVLRSKLWNRLNGKEVKTFEEQYAKLTGAGYCLGVTSGTSALYTMLGVQEIGPGDEVILPAYTFIATYNVVTLNYALPVLVDTDMETFQIDASKIASAITSQTRLIVPVHLGGSPADLDTILAIGEKSGIPVIEDACQAHLAEWRGKKVGTLGLGGAFSFQVSKNLNCAEGGAILSNNKQFIENCYVFHNQGRKGGVASYAPGIGTRGVNMRLTEFQGALLLAQMTRLEAQSKERSENAAYLTALLNNIPGITPAKPYAGTTRNAYHLYMFRYDKNSFDGLSRERFIEALKAEGIPCASGYSPMDRDAFVTNLANNEHYLFIYGEKTMQEWKERIRCPQNEKLCNEQAVWFFQEMLLGSRSQMEQIAEAISKIRKNARRLIV